MTQHIASVNTALHPALHKALILRSDAIVISGTMLPVNVTGKPVIVTSQMCVDCTFVPSERLMDMGFVARRLFCTLVPFMTNTDVAPVSAIAWAGSIDNALALC